MGAFLRAAFRIRNASHLFLAIRAIYICAFPSFCARFVPQRGRENSQKRKKMKTIKNLKNHGKCNSQCRKHSTAAKELEIH
jgi:hypothetical protein